MRRLNYLKAGLVILMISCGGSSTTDNIIMEDPKEIWWHETMECMGVDSLEMPEFVFDVYDPVIKGICPLGSVACYDSNTNIVYMIDEIYIDEDTPEGSFKECHAYQYREEYTHAIEYQTDQVVPCKDESLGNHCSKWFLTQECIRLPNECPTPDILQL